jgi:hypothetical protein
MVVFPFFRHQPLPQMASFLISIRKVPLSRHAPLSESNAHQRATNYIKGGVVQNHLRGFVSSTGAAQAYYDNCEER